MQTETELNENVSLSVEASNARPSSTGVDNGVDVDVTISWFGTGKTARGTVTLVPHEDPQAGLGAWGAPDNWVSGGLLLELAGLSRDEYRAALAAIEAEAVWVAR
jgi:hypothetical protein